MKTNLEKLLKVGCKVEGEILVTPFDEIVPVDIKRLKGWNEDRVNNYIKDIEDARVNK